MWLSVLVGGADLIVPPRPMDPKKDLAVYGYGTVAWKDRMEEWRKRQNDKLQMVRHEGDGVSNDGDEPDDPDLPKYVHCFHFLLNTLSCGVLTRSFCNWKFVEFKEVNYQEVCFIRGSV